MAAVRRRLLLTALVALLAIMLWALLVLQATLNGWLRTPLAAAGDHAAFFVAARDRIAAERAGNAVLRVLRDGEVIGEYATSVGAPVDVNTLFQVASVSKWLTAVGVLTLVDAGKLDLDAPVSRYLTRWSLPPSPYETDGVTVRRLLSHTAGLTDGLGYGGFAPGETPQTLEASLTRAADASPGADGRTHIGMPPGTEWVYSGGGYTLLQLLVEETAGEPFAHYMQRAVFAPLGMHRSSYLLPPATPNVAAIFDVDGRPVLARQFTAQAAAALYTSAADLTLFLGAHRPGVLGEPVGRGVLRPATLASMREPQAAQYGADIWGLGTMLFAPHDHGGFVIGHDGSNEPAINAAVRVDPASGDAIIVLVTGNSLLATTIASEWTFWHTGAIDMLDFQRGLGRMLRTLAAGATVILAIATILGVAWRRNRAATMPPGRTDGSPAADSAGKLD